jgi:hypothetical protein
MLAHDSLAFGWVAGDNGIKQPSVFEAVNLGPFMNGQVQSNVWGDSLPRMSDLIGQPRAAGVTAKRLMKFIVDM